MKTSSKLIALLIASLPVIGHASDGAEALQRFHEKNKVTTTQQAKEIEKHKEKETQNAAQEKNESLSTNRQNDGK